MPGRTTKAVRDTEGQLRLLPEDAVKNLYQTVHGTYSDDAERFGIKAGPASGLFAPRLEHPTQSRPLLQQMYPDPPPVEIGNNEVAAIAHEFMGNVYARGFPSNATLAHEFEHAQQDSMKGQHAPRGAPITSLGNLWSLFTEAARVLPQHAAGVNPVYGAAAHEIGPTILGEVFPQASHESNNPSALATQEHKYRANFNKNYAPEMTWLHNQAQQHGVFGPTPMAKTLGYKGTQPTSITQQIANNPQWLGTIADSPLPVINKARPQKNLLSPPNAPKPAMPNLAGYLK